MVNNSEINPEVYLCARSPQPRIVLPEHARPFDTYPNDPMEILAAAQTYHEAR